MVDCRKVYGALVVVAVMIGAVKVKEGTGLQNENTAVVWGTVSGCVVTGGEFVTVVGTETVTGEFQVKRGSRFCRLGEGLGTLTGAADGPSDIPFRRNRLKR